MDSIPKNDPQQILRAVKLLFPDDGVVELRSLQKRATISGYFDDYEQLAKAAAGIREGNTYITLNRIDPSLLARCANRIERAKNTTTDSQVIRWQLLLIDSDCQRPSGISATDEGHDAAIAKAKAIGRALVAQGWPQHILCDSGNGSHVLFRINLPNDDMSTRGKLQKIIRRRECVTCGNRITTSERMPGQN